MEFFKNILVITTHCELAINYRIKTGHFDNDRDIGPISFVMARERAPLSGHNEEIGSIFEWPLGGVRKKK